MLLDAGANVDSPNLDNQTALMVAISTGSLPISKLLVERGANVNAIETFRNQNALMWAAAEMHRTSWICCLRTVQRMSTCVQSLTTRHDSRLPNHGRSTSRDRPAGSPRCCMPRAGLPALRCLVGESRRRREQAQSGWRHAAHQCAGQQAYDIAMFLLDKGANAHAWDMSGRTPIYVAVDMNSFRGGGFGGGGGRNGSRTPEGQADAQPDASAVTAMDVVHRLLDMGVDVNHELTRKRPYGAGRGRFEDYDLRGGVSALFVATMRQDHEAMAALLAHGAEVDLNNVLQMTPLMIAASMRAQAGPAVAPPGGGVAGGDPQARMIKSIDLLLDAGADINARVTNSRTHTAKIMAYVQGRDQEGRTALFAAGEAGNDRVVKHLLARGADPAVRDAGGKTALDAARAPPPAGPGAGAAAAAAGSPAATAAAASRAATIAILEPLVK